ncbi:MAG: hypothetical protein A2Y62_17915 [Candidatus Fischerbacteria bacterium RBG_13_37_8]|uniref:Uncharacterized protein n=1 Tax=Candidatus Fischerbacteria bacterium RBG_13_37_8 TaxID=1817863 RepID=A0A1F5VV79_9BACT|nr:MAG: hypothetical protein A2Y62_17915 [Candidatus Fischerbacteria bacterium RBG_13_37_8]
MKKKQFEKPANNNSYIIFVVLTICITGFAIYSNTFHSSFSFDDYKNIVENTEIHDGSVIPQLNKPRYFGLVSFAINYDYNELDTYGYHIVNIIIHLINSFLVYLIVRKILVIINLNSGTAFNKEIPLYVALIFLVHPIQTQAVTYIVQRFTSLAALFSLACILFYIKFRSSKEKTYSWFILSLISCLFAFKTKENTATIPIIIIAIELLLFRHQKITKERILYVLPFFILIVVIPLSFINIDKPLGELIGDIAEVSFETKQITRTQYFLTQMRVITTYIRLFFYPVNQAVDYYYPLSYSLFESQTFISFSFLLVLTVIALLAARKYSATSLGLAWFFIFLAVESSIIPIRDVIFEHRMYLPSIGLIIVVVVAIFLLQKKMNWCIVAPIILTAFIIVLAISTYFRNMIWEKEIYLWEDTANKYPLNARAVNNVAVALVNSRYFKESIEYATRAIELDPNNSKYWYDLAIAYKFLNENDKAIEAYRKTLELSPQYQKATIDLAFIYVNKRDIQKAYNILMEAKKYNPDHPYTDGMLAYVYCQTGDLNKAISLFNEAIKNNLDHSDIYFNFAICLINHGKLAESRENFLRVIRFNPGEVDSYYFIAVTYDDEKNYEKALYFYEQFLARAKKSQWLEESFNRVSQLKRITSQN